MPGESDASTLSLKWYVDSSQLGLQTLWLLSVKNPFKGQLTLSVRLMTRHEDFLPHSETPRLRTVVAETLLHFLEKPKSSKVSSRRMTVIQAFLVKALVSRRTSSRLTSSSDFIVYSPASQTEAGMDP